MWPTVWPGVKKALNRRHVPMSMVSLSERGLRWQNNNSGHKYQYNHVAANRNHNFTTLGSRDIG